MENPETLLEMQRKVQMMMGRCLLNYQLIEQQLKQILSLSSIEVRKNVNGEYHAVHSDYQRMTLGVLFREYFSTIALPVESSYASENNALEVELNETYSQIKFRQVFDDRDIYDSIKDNTKKLVCSRNILVHHFYESHLLDTCESCAEALNALEIQHAFTIEQFNFFKNIKAHIGNSFNTLANALEDENIIAEIENFSVNSDTKIIH